MSYVPSRRAVKQLGLHPTTLRRYADEGKISYYKNQAGQRLYDVESYIQLSCPASIVLYARVSSVKQRNDLNRQVACLQELYPNAEVIKDIGGGLNWKRKGLITILERLHRGDKLTIVVAHRDRLARFGFELIEWLAQQNGGSVVVCNKPDTSPESELTEDLFAILHTFSCRMHGLRKYRKTISQDKSLPNIQSEENNNNLV